MKLIIFDTETTGLPKTKNINIDYLYLWPYIVQFSYIIYDTEINKILKIKDSIIEIPETIIISKENSDIHGITNEISKEKGQDIKLIISDFIEDCNNSDLLIAHNMEFDINVLKVEILRHQLNKSEHDLNNIKKYCTMKTTITFCNIKKINKNGIEFIKFPKLSELHKKLFNTIPKNLHNSLNDVIVCLRCYYMLTQQKDLLEINDKVKDLFECLL